MVTVELECGLTLEVDETCVDDMELFDAICELTNGNLMKMPMVVTKICGAENKQKLYEHFRDESGRVSIKKIDTAVGEILQKLFPKN